MYILFTNQIYFYVINLLVYFTKKNKNQDIYKWEKKCITTKAVKKKQLLYKYMNY